MSEIEPLLTHDQWLELHTAGVRVRQRIWIRIGSAGIEMQDSPFGADGVRWSAFFGEAARQRLGAVALHGQPFGFTWEDVDLLRSLPPEGVWMGEGRRPVLELADRIAALLPPRV